MTNKVEAVRPKEKLGGSSPINAGRVHESAFQNWQSLKETKKGKYLECLPKHLIHSY